MVAPNWVLLALGLCFGVIALVFLLLDFRKCDREQYTERFGRKSGSLWMRMATPVMLIASILIKSAFHH